jgi:hypothetical protein
MIVHAMRTTCFLFLAIMILHGLAVGASAGPLPLRNPGFEKGRDGWSVPGGGTAGVEITAEAARNGKLGLRVTDKDPATDVTVRAAPVPAKPGKTYRVSFAGRSVDGGRGFNVFVRFLDADQKHIPLKDGHRYHFMITEDHKEWGRFSLDGTAPKGTAFAEVYVRTNKVAVVVADVDDFSIEEIF